MHARELPEVQKQLIFKLFSRLPKLWDKVIEHFVSNSFACLVYFGVCLYQAGEMINDQSEYVVVGKIYSGFQAHPLNLSALTFMWGSPSALRHAQMTFLLCTTLPCGAPLNVIFNKRPKLVILLSSILCPHPHVPHFCAAKWALSVYMWRARLGVFL